MHTADPDYLKNAVAQLKANGMRFEDGLSDAEIQDAEALYKIRFPPDLRAFLQIALPIERFVENPMVTYTDDRFPNWRSRDTEAVDWIQHNLNFPIEALVWAVENKKFWLKRFGKKPRKY